jgi:DNA-3-methyladenine glycosylase
MDRIRVGAKKVSSAAARKQPESVAGGRIRRLRRAELPVDTVDLARFLIGKVLVRDLPEGRLAGRIVETEAYVVGDAAGHAYRGETPRNRSLFLERGHAYVYFIYGFWYCVNVSGESPGVGAGVLLRSLEPLIGIETMQRLRGTLRELDLARGPGRLTQALGIDRREDGVDLCKPGSLWLGALPTADIQIGRSVRIGLTREAHRPLRFYARGSPFVSGPKRLGT